MTSISRAAVTRASELAVDGDAERHADLAHARIRQSAESIDEHADGNALDRVQIDCGTERNGIVCGLEDHFAGKPADRRRTGRDERSP